ncbi:MAG: hypothetical protein HDT12_01175, partial [Helicobacter sp.]|nr:hypothetical protein [Helicobacter sp.]
MAKEFIAYLDTQGFFTNQKCFILTDNIKDKNRLLYLTAILNSRTNFWYFKQIGATLGASGYEMSKIFVEKLPVIETNKIDSKLLVEIESLAKEILEINNSCHSEGALATEESHNPPPNPLRKGGGRVECETLAKGGGNACHSEPALN